MVASNGFFSKEHCCHLMRRYKYSNSEQDLRAIIA